LRFHNFRKILSHTGCRCSYYKLSVRKLPLPHQKAIFSIFMNLSHENGFQFWDDKRIFEMKILKFYSNYFLLKSLKIFKKEIWFQFQKICFETIVIFKLTSHLYPKTVSSGKIVFTSIQQESYCISSSTKHEKESIWKILKTSYSPHNFEIWPFEPQLYDLWRYFRDASSLPFFISQRWEKMKKFF